MEVSLLHLFYPSLKPKFTASVALGSHPVLSNASLSYHLDEVDCNGDESMLSECRNEGLGVHDCALREEEAGVLCSHKFYS